MSVVVKVKLERENSERTSREIRESSRRPEPRNLDQSTEEVQEEVHDECQKARD